MAAHETPETTPARSSLRVARSMDIAGNRYAIRLETGIAAISASGGRPQRSESAPSLTSLTQRPAMHPAAWQLAWQKCVRPHDRQKAIRHSAHQPNGSGSGLPHTAHATAE